MAVIAGYDALPDRQCRNCSRKRRGIPTAVCRSYVCQDIPIPSPTGRIELLSACGRLLTGYLNQKIETTIVSIEST